MIDTNIIMQAAVDTAMWSTHDDRGEPLRDSYFNSDLAPETVENLHMDVHLFVEENIEDLMASNLDSLQIGHDFILTRNGHGAGFWDRGLGEVGDRLSEAAKSYGSFDLYVGDDGLLYT